GVSRPGYHAWKDRMRRLAGANPHPVASDALCAVIQDCHAHRGVRAPPPRQAGLRLRPPRPAVPPRRPPPRPLPARDRARPCPPPGPPGSLVIADMWYVSYAWFDHVVGTGHHWLSRCRARTSTVTRQVLYAAGDGSVSDRIVWLGAHTSTRASRPVRLVEFRAGGTTRAFLTSVLDPAKLSVRDIAVAYARRWDIEMAFDLLKRHLNLHMVWSPRPALVVAQVYATLAVAQAVRALRMEVAIRAGADPFEVSIPLLLEMIPRCRAAYTPLDHLATTTRANSLGYMVLSRPKGHRATGSGEPSPARGRSRTGSPVRPPSDQTPRGWVVPIQATSRVRSPRTHAGHTARCPRTTRGPVRHSGRTHGR
ncbi:MAG: hypothetical protein EBT00_15930, partial [Proteobacteria bacterium]|nr:hypothetical protein [Pseudomonadota bacterium]